MDRRRISLSLKQANEGVDPSNTEFDPSLYGMTAEYDEEGNYKYPEGFDPETNEWMEGYEEQRAAWETSYAAAQARFEAHKEQVKIAQEADKEAAIAQGVAEQTSYSSTTEEEADTSGTLADDEALAALRDKLAGE